MLRGKLAKSLKLSAQGEYELTDLNSLYLEKGQLQVEIMGRGYAWLDTGTHDSLLDASGYISVLEKRQGYKVACPEEIRSHAQRKSPIGRNGLTAPKLRGLHQPMLKNGYGKYLMQLLG